MIAHNDDVSDGLANERTGNRRDAGDRAVSRIGFVFAHDPEDLTLIVIALDRHPVATYGRRTVAAYTLLSRPRPMGARVPASADLPIRLSSSDA
jgi:hypothetical protein